jgi:hypothetical protein
MPFREHNNRVTILLSNAKVDALLSFETPDVMEKPLSRPLTPATLTVKSVNSSYESKGKYC